MEKRQKRRRSRKEINLVTAQNWRDAELSYAQIGAKMGVSPTGVYYKLNPRKRKRNTVREDGLARSIWISDTDWEGVRALAREQQITMAEFVRRLVRAALPAEEPTL